MKRLKKAGIKVLNFLKKELLWEIILFPIILIFGLYIRIQNLELLKDKYLLALDPYIFLRYARVILESGKLFAVDQLRYVPLGIETIRENIFLSYYMVFQFKVLNMFIPDMTIEKSTILYPVIMFALGLVVFYFLIRELFNAKVAILGSLFLVIAPAFLYRTMAGFADKEALAIFFMFTAFLLYVKAYKAKKIKHTIILGTLAGIATGLMAQTWGGVKFAIMIIGFYNLILVLLNKAKHKDLYLHLSWLIPVLIILPSFTQKFGGLQGVLTSETIILNMISIILFYILSNSHIRSNLTLKNISIGIAAILILGIIIIGPTTTLEKIKDVETSLMHPMGTNRITLTVAENKQPYLSDWIGQFGMFLYLFMLGSIFLFNNSFKKYKIYLTGAFVFLLIGMIYSRFNSLSRFNGENLASTILLFGSIGIFIITGLFLFIKEKNIFLKINKNIYFILAWFFVMLISARGAVRLFFILTPIAASLAAYFVVTIYYKAKQQKDKFYKVSLVLLLLLITIPPIYSFSQTSLRQASFTGPSFNNQWQYAMDWVQSNTYEDSVFAHWWDYGYWVQANGNRATILDGMNAISYWNHLMGRHVLAAKTDLEALEFLKVHNATHLLIISDEIGKYQAYSSIGSDENFDIFSWIGSFTMNPYGTAVKDNITTYYFQGGVALDEEFTFNNKVLPATETVIGGFFVPVDEENDNKILQPNAVLYFEGQRIDVPVECLYDQNKKLYFNESGLKGCLRIMPRFINYQYQQENGALLYVSRKGLDTLWTRLFLFNEESDYFKPVFDDKGTSPLGILNNNIIGPLKIWEIDYPDNLSISEEKKIEYLSKTTPNWLELRESSPLLEK